VAARLGGAGLAGRTVQLKVRFGDFRTITRSRTVKDPLTAGPELARVAGELLAGVDVSPGVRLLGVSVANLGERPAIQLDLLAGGGWAHLGQAVHDVRRRFGDGAVGPAALLGTGVRRPGDQQWGPNGGDGVI
jgi:DNA polymerase-4